MGNSRSQDVLNKRKSTSPSASRNDQNFDASVESESANENNAKGDPARNPKVYTHTSDRNKIKVTGTSNGNLQQKLLSNRTLPIITTKIDPPILDRVETCGGTPHALATPTTKGVITDKTHSSARIL